MKESKKIFVVLSSHLDREWYFTFEKFRVMISQIINRVIELIDNRDIMIPFLLDGQMIVLDDYLDIYPEKEAIIKRLISEGKLIIGPWYVQPDELLIEGESLIRNLRLGFDKAKPFGKLMKIAYLPDSFGHISQMPQILKDFGVDKVFLMRGIEKSEAQELFWESPDSSIVKLIHNEYANSITMDIEKMENGIRIISEPKMLKERFDELSKSTQSESEYLLVTLGGDHTAPPLNIVELLNETQREYLDIDSIKFGSLEEYFETIDWDKSLPVKRGELRNSEDIRVLNDVAAARNYLKKRNQEIETKLLRQAEAVTGTAFSLGIDTGSEFLPKAWEILMQNHTHDGICGCSNDNVHREMMVRFQKAEDIIDQVTMLNLEKIATEIEIPNYEDNDYILLVFNGNGFGFNGFVEAKIIMPDHRPEISFRIFDENNKELPYQIRETYTNEVIDANIDRVQQFKKQRIVKIVFFAEAIDAIGYRSYTIRFNDNSKPMLENRTTEDCLVHDGYRIENDLVSAEFSENGTISIKDKERGFSYNNLHYFVDEGSVGDVYQYIKPTNDKVFDSRDIKWDIKVINNGPFLQSVNMSAQYFLPSGINKKESKRNSDLIQNDISVRIDLYAGSRLLRFKTKIINRSKNHRIRLLFPTDANTNHAIAGTSFFVETRHIDQYPLLHTFQKFVDVRDENRGVSFFGKGLHQYQLINDESRTLAITLLRSEDILYHWAFDQNSDFSEAQCIGENDFEYALLVHDGKTKKSNIYKEAVRFNTDPAMYFGRAYTSGSINMNKSIVEIDQQDDIVLSAFKIADNREYAELRIFNLSEERKKAKILIGAEISSAVLSDLVGNVTTELKYDYDKVFVELNAHKIATVNIQYSKKE